MIYKVWNVPKYVLIFFIMILASLDGVLISSLFKNLIDLASQDNPQEFLQLICVILLIYAIVLLSNYIYNRMKYQFVFDANLYIKKKIMQNFLLQDSRAYSEAEVKKETISFFMNDLKLLETNYIIPFFDMYLYIFYAFTAFVYSFFIDSALAFIFLAFSLIPSIVPVLFKKVLADRTKNWSNLNQDYTETLNETIESSEEIKEFHTETIFIKRFFSRALETEKSFFMLNNMQSLSILVIGCISILCYIFPLAIGGYFVMSQQTSLSNLIAVFFASNRIITPVKLAINIYNQFNSVKTIREKVEEVLQKDITKYQQKYLPVEKISIKSGNVSLGGNLILKNIQLDLTNKDKVLVVGESGAGKSILLNLVKGNIPLNEGDYIIEPKNSILNIAYQKDFIFKDSLSFNILFSNELVSEDLNNIFEIDNKFPKMIDYQGKNLSGGQIKRINLARILSHGSSLLLDEPFQGLSTKQSSSIEKYLLKHTDFLMISSHVLHEENLSKYSKYIVVENKTITVYKELSEFKKTNYYQQNNHRI